VLPTAAVADAADNSSSFDLPFLAGDGSADIRRNLSLMSESPNTDATFSFS